LFIAVGLSMKNDGSVREPRNAPDGAVRYKLTVELPYDWKLLNRLPYGAPDFGSYFLNPPNTVCQ
jgi:hypothetical protein